MRHARGECIPLSWRAAAAERYAVAMARIRFILAAALALASCAGAPVLEGERLVDLTHPFDQDTIYWPGNQGFELEHTKWGEDAQGHWYAAAQFRAAEHGGTHLDAPLHFAHNGRAVADIPLAQLVGPARVIDVQPQCVANRDYLVSVEDITAHEAAQGRLSEGSVVLIRTGWSRSWPDRKRYLGNDDPEAGGELHFPGLSREAARLLGERHVALVGIDTASLDHGLSTDFPAHRVLAEAGVSGLENLTGLEELPVRGATVLALPMMIGGGSGAPARVIALLP
jgi:kynurenine formamidase